MRSRLVGPPIFLHITAVCSITKVAGGFDEQKRDFPTALFRRMNVMNYVMHVKIEKKVLIEEQNKLEVNRTA